MRPILSAALLVSATLVPAKGQTFSDNDLPMNSLGWYWSPGPMGADRQPAVRGRAGSVSRSCLTAETRSTLARLEATFGPVKVVSTCRPGAVIAGSRRPSLHRYGMAVDFVPPGGRRGDVIRWLHANNRGMVITYSRHIHFDTGAYRSLACAECGTRRARRAYASRR